MDPLRPFAMLIRSLWTTKSRSNRRAQRATTKASEPQQGVTGIEPRLRVRLSTLSQWHPARAREMFVETVLLSELGVELERDPGFQPLVQNVSAHLGSLPAISSRLDELLQALLQGQHKNVR
jgi:hypothetical protein